MSLRILYEDNHLLAVDKPPGLPTQGAAQGTPSLVTLAKQYLKQKYRKPGNVYLGVVSRLDASTSGVVVLARTSKAAARLSEQFRSRAVRKAYCALVEGRIEPPASTCVDWLGKDDEHARMKILAGRSAGAQEATMHYRRLKLGRLPAQRSRADAKSKGPRKTAPVDRRHPNSAAPMPEQVSLLEVCLETGRKHQVRVQLAARGHPIVGDRKYGAHSAFANGIALHCRELVIEHPTRRTPLKLTAPLPAAWKDFNP